MHLLKIFTAAFIGTFFKQLLTWTAFTFLVIYLPIDRWDMVPQLTREALLMVLGIFIGLTSFILAYITTD